MRDAGGSVETDGQGVFIGDARAVGIGNGGAEFGGAPFDLVTRAVDEDDLDVERAQDRDVEQHIGKILRINDLAVDGDDESAFAETRDILENAAEIGNVHGEWQRWQKRDDKLTRFTAGATFPRSEIDPTVRRG